MVQFSATFSEDNQGITLGFEPQNQLMVLKLSENPRRLHTNVDDLNKPFSVKFGNVTEIESKESVIYEGETTVTPLAANQVVLNTANKKVLEDIKVKKIPYYETSNDYGETIYIGEF